MGYEAEFSTGRLWKKMFEQCLAGFAWGRPAWVAGSEEESKQLEVLQFLLTEFVHEVDEHVGDNLERTKRQKVLEAGRYGARSVRRAVADLQHVNCARVLVQLGGLELDEGFPQSSENDPLFCACRDANPTFVRFLVEECGVDVTREDMMGQTAIYHAVDIPWDIRFIKSVDKLLRDEEDLGADAVWRREVDAYIDRKRECLEILLEAGLGIDHGSTTPLQHLFQQNAFDMNYQDLMGTWKLPRESGKLFGVVENLDEYVWNYIESMLKILVDLGANENGAHLEIEKGEDRLQPWEYNYDLETEEMHMREYEEFPETLEGRCGILGAVLLWGASPDCSDVCRRIALRVLRILVGIGIKTDLEGISALELEVPSEDDYEGGTDEEGEVREAGYRKVPIVRLWGDYYWGCVQEILEGAAKSSESHEEEEDDSEPPLLVPVDDGVSEILLEEGIEALEV